MWTRTNGSRQVEQWRKNKQQLEDMGARSIKNGARGIAAYQAWPITAHG